MKIYALGPVGTFSYVAALHYQKQNDEIITFSTIDEAVKHLESDEDIAVIPLNNTLDGYVQRTLDLLFSQEVYITEVHTIKVSFDLIANCDDLSKIKRIFVQFKANGQVKNILSQIPQAKIVTTESNIESFEKVQEEGDAAIIPSHINGSSFKLHIKNVTDMSENETRFIVLRKKETKIVTIDRNVLVAMFIIPTTDHAGLLYDILKKFYYGNINLTSIMSRPKRTEMNKYNFYVEAVIPASQYDTVYKFLNDQEENYKIKFVGSAYLD